MHVDDRLATVLAASATGENQRRVQFRQLLDLLGTTTAAARSPLLDSALLRLAEVSATIPAADRAAAIAAAGVRLRNPRLVAELANDRPPIAAAAIAAAQLGDEQWLDILPTLPAAARGLLRRRAGIGADLARRLDQLGAADTALPAPGHRPAAAASATVSSDVGPGDAGKVLPLRTRGERRPPATEPAATGNSGADAQRDGIGAILRRIEAFRRLRATELPVANDAPLLPLEDDTARPMIQAFGFASDATGRIWWSDTVLAGSLTGMALPLADGPEHVLAIAHRRRVPIRAARVHLEGAPVLAGEWIVDAAPEFDRQGRFAGYLGKFRRPPPPSAAPAVHPEAQRVRQVLHELRTPVNAIQGFAEMIHQQLVGDVPHGYRALAAGIAADAAQMLAGFEELDRLARLDSGALALEPGQAQLPTTLVDLIGRLTPFTAPRSSGFALAVPDACPPVAMAAAEVERLAWRLLATLAAAAHPGETLPITLTATPEAVTLAIGLPESLAVQPDPLDAAPPVSPQPVNGGLFGAGFALRLAGAEARAAGGSMVIERGRILICLPVASAMELTGAHDLPNPLEASASTPR